MYIHFNKILIHIFDTILLMGTSAFEKSCLCKPVIYSTF